jgi:hypothetical protein
MQDDIFQKKSRFYHSTTAFFWYVVVLMIYKNKNIVAKLKIQNGGLIQDGYENIFYFSHNKSPFWVFGLTTLILFYLTSTTTYQKMRTFHSAVVL